MTSQRRATNKKNGDHREVLEACPTSNVLLEIGNSFWLSFLMSAFLRRISYLAGCLYLALMPVIFQRQRLSFLSQTRNTPGLVRPWAQPNILSPSSWTLTISSNSLHSRSLLTSFKYVHVEHCRSFFLNRCFHFLSRFCPIFCLWPARGQGRTLHCYSKYRLCSASFQQIPILIALSSWYTHRRKGSSSRLQHLQLDNRKPGLVVPDGIY